MQVKSNLNLKQSNCQNDVRFECLSRKRSSNWRPPVERNYTISTRENFGKYVTNEENNENYSLKRKTAEKRKQKSYQELNNRLVKNFTTINNDDINSNSKKTHENSHYWPRSRHKDKNEKMTIINTFSADINSSDVSDSYHQPQSRTPPPLPMSKIDLHSSAATGATPSSSVAISDIYSRCFYSKEQHVNDDEDESEGDFVYRKERNLFFRRNQTHLMKQWKYSNFFNWLVMNDCYTKTLFNAGGGLMMRCKKTISYFGGGKSSTIMLFLLIFSILISGPGEAYPVEGGYEIQKLASTSETTTDFTRIIPDIYSNNKGGASQNGFGLKYVDTSSLEFGRKIDRDSDLAATKTKETYDIANLGNEEESISSSLLVSSSETVQIEASLDSQELVKPSRVKKRNFASKDPSKSANILKSHIDSNNFRHTSKSSSDEEHEEKIKPPLAIANSVAIPFGAKTKTTRTVESSTASIKEKVADANTKQTTRSPITPKFIPFGQKTKTTAPTTVTSTSSKTSTSSRTTESTIKNSTPSSPKDTTLKLRFGQKFPKTTSTPKTTASTTTNEVIDQRKITQRQSTTTPFTITRPETKTSSTTTTSNPTSTKRRLIKSTTVTSTPLNTSRRRSTTQTTIRSIPVSRNPTSSPRRLKVATTLVPKLPSAQPLIRTSVRDVVTNEQATDGKKNGKEAVIRFVSTVSPRPFNKKKDRETTEFMKIVKKKVAKGGDNKRIPFTIRTIVRRPTTTTTSSSTSTKPTLSDVTTSVADSSFTGSRPGSGFVVKKARPLDGSGRRIRLRDSLLARVQGKFRARSTTVKPDIEQDDEKETKEKTKATSGMLMLKRSRIRPKNEASNNATESKSTTTPTTIKTLPIANATASPLLSLRKELNSLIQKKKSSNNSTKPFHEGRRKAVKKVKITTTTTTTTTKTPSVVTRRYETPPSRGPKPLSSSVEVVSKPRKEPKIRLSKTTRASKITTKTTTAASTTKNIKTQEKDMSTKTTLSVSLGGSTSVKVSTEANTSIPDVRLKIKSQDGERSHNNNTENEDEESNFKIVPEEVLTPPPRKIERPQGLEQELLAAIRRKISSKTTATKTTRIENSDRKSKPTESRSSILRPKFRLTQKTNSPRLANIDIDVSPASNSVSSTQHPPFFRPIPSFPNPAILKSSTGKPHKTRLPQNLQPPRVRFYVRVPGEGGIGTKSHGHDSSIRIPNFSHIQGKLKRLNAAISESFLKSKNKEANKSFKEESVRKNVEPSLSRAPIVKDNKEDKKSIDLDEQHENSAQQPAFDSSENKIPSYEEPIIITSTSISISLEENVVPFITSTTTKPQKPKSTSTPSTTSTTAPSTTLKPKITKGFISSQDYIRLRTTTKDTKRPQKVAKKTQTYLDKVRQKYVIENPSTTTSASTTRNIIFNEENYPEHIDHPTSHRRPSYDEENDFPEIPKSGTANGDRSNIRGVQLVTPVYGEFTPSSSDRDANHNLNYPRLLNAGNSSKEEQLESGENAEESVIHDITGTTVYVVGVICVIPAAGLVAWVVRYVVKKKDLSGNSGSENCSETGLNCPLSRGGGSSGDRDRGDAEDLIQQGRSHGMGQSQIGHSSHHGALHALAHASQSHLRRGSDRDNNINSDESDDHVDGEISGGNVDDLLGGTIKKKSQEILLANSAWQFSRQNLRLLTILGEGNFGRVWKAEADNICGYEGTAFVAVKTLKDNAAEKEKSDLLQEIQIMQQVGATHPNIVTLLGVCTEKEPYLLILEYVMYGKLLTHLREQRSRGQTSLFDEFTGGAGTDDILGGDSISRDGSDTEDGGGRSSSTITAKDLTKYAYGVAKGMEYLVSKSIIHRDLAARNILLDHNKVCKISDFGLSRNLGDTGSEMYEQKTKGALPIRWMAPESLYFSVFTPKSDVWSFGILMWEIVTLGSTPYPGMGAREVMRRVRDGYRLERPSHCHPELYKIISKCWAGDMNKRPDFTELRQELAKLLENQHGYIDLQNIPENKYYSMTQAENEEEKI